MLPTMSVCRRSLLPLIVFLAAAFGLYGATFHHPFIYDDLIAIVDNPYVHTLGNLGSFFLCQITPQGNFFGACRPLTMITFALTHHFFGLDVATFRLLDLCLHAVNALLLFLLGRQLLREKQPQERESAVGVAAPWLLALFFLVHPLQAQSINFIWKRSGLLSSFFILCAALAYIQFLRHKRPFAYGLSLLALIGGILSKEDAYALPLLLLLLTLYFERETGGWRRFLPLLPAFGIAVFFLCLRQLIFSSQTADAAALPITAGYFQAQVQVFFRYLWLCLAAHPLSIDHRVVPVAGWAGRAIGVGGGIGLGVLIGAALWLWKRCPEISFAVLSYLVLLLPSSSVFHLSLPMDEHRLYLPLYFFGLALWMGLIAAAERLPQKKLGRLRGKRLALLVFSALVAGQAFTTALRNPLYRSEKALWNEALAIDPDNDRALINLANLAIGEGQFAEARTLALQAVRLRPESDFPYINLGTACLGLGEIGCARGAFRKALALHPRNMLTLYNLGVLALRQNDPVTAQGLLTRMRGIKADHPLVASLQRWLPPAPR